MDCGSSLRRRRSSSSEKLKISSPHGVLVIIETRTVNDLFGATRSAASSISRAYDSNAVLDLPCPMRLVTLATLLIRIILSIHESCTQIYPGQKQELQELHFQTSQSTDSTKHSPNKVVQPNHSNSHQTPTLPIQ